MGRREAEFPNEPQTIGDLMAAPNPQGALMTDLTKLLADLKSGAWRVVPGEATEGMMGPGVYAAADVLIASEYCNAPDASFILALAHRAFADGYAAMLAASPDHTTDLVEMIEGLVRESETVCNSYVAENQQLSDRVLAAEAERDALREALLFIARYSTDSDASFRARRVLKAHPARALTKEQTDGE